MPAGAAAALALLGALQLGWSRPIILPPPDAITPLRLPPVVPARVPVPSATVGSPFATGAQAAVAADPFAGMRAVGVATRGGRSIAFLQAPDGRVAGLGAGQFIAGWQLVAIGRDALRFRRGGEVAALPIGASAVPAPVDEGRR